MNPEEETEERNRTADTERSSDLHFDLSPAGGAEEQTLAGVHKVDARFVCSVPWLKLI